MSTRAFFSKFVKDETTGEWKPRPDQMEPVSRVPMKLDTHTIVLRARGQSRVHREREQSQKSVVA